MARLYVLLALLLVQTAGAHSNATQIIPTQSGLSFSLPARFLPEQVRVPPTQADGPKPELLRVDGDTPSIRLMVVQAPIDGAEVLRTLPRNQVHYRRTSRRASAQVSGTRRQKLLV